jgi:HlyD family secretion protein
VSVPNTDGKLLPGMTARVQFLTKQADNVLKISNSALRYKPTDAEVAALKSARQATSTSTTSTATSTARSGRNGGTRTGSSNFGTLYYLDANGKLAVARVKTGINDGSTTEITGKTIKEGMKVIAGTVSPTTATTAQTSTAPASPFQGGQQQGGAQRGGGQRGGF